MRIAVLTNTTSPSTGAGRIAAIYNELLAARGHDVRVFGPAAWFERLTGMPSISRLLRHLSDLRPNQPTVDEILEWKPDVLLTHNLTGCGFGTPKKIQEATVRWVHLLHDVQLFEPSGRIIHGETSPKWRAVWRRGWSSMRKKVFGNPDAVVSPTSWLLKTHMGFGFFSDSDRHIIPNPLRIEEVELFSIERDPRRVAYVGRLDADKGADLVYDAWPKLRDVASELILVGDGSWRERFSALREPSVIVRGVLPNAEVFRTLVGSGVFAAPSRVAENQPTVILEALAAGCRVVAADVGGVRETLGDAGWIVEPGSVRALVDGITTALASQEDKHRSAERERILRAHDPDSAVEALLGVLASNL